MINPRTWMRPAAIVPVVFCLAVISGMFVPVYTDEVGWRLQERAGLDGVDKLFSLLCGPTSVVTPPMWMMPVRYYSAFWNMQFASPFYTRVSGVVYALAWGALLARLIWRIFPDMGQRRTMLVAAFGLATLGVMPWLLIWSRPEQPVLLCLTGAVLIACDGWNAHRRPAHGRDWLRILGIVVLAAVSISYHLKGLFLLPVFLACIATSSAGRGTVLSRALGALLVVLLTIDGLRYWIGRLHCPVDLAYQQSQNIAAALLEARTHAEVGAVLLIMAKNLNPLLYLARTVPRPNPMSSWLAEEQIGMTPALIWWGLVTFIWCLMLVFACGAMLRVSRAGERARRRRVDPRVLVAVALAVSILGWSATQVSKNDYEALLIVPMFLLIIVVGLSCAKAPDVIFVRLRKLLVGAVPIVGASVLLVGAIFGPSLARAFDQRGYIDEQPYSVAAFDYEETRSRLHALARSCGIDADNSESLVLDDVTYYAFMQSPTPDHARSGFEPTDSAELTTRYLRARRSSGYIASCSLLPKSLQSMAKRDGDFCCLAPTWNGPVTPPAR